MQLAFYSSSVSAGQHQKKIDVIANNIANVNTDGFKAERTTFYDLLYQNVRAPEGQLDAPKSGVGTRLETNTMTNRGSIRITDSKTDYYIETEGMFAVRNPETNEIFYTQTGNFIVSENINKQFYLTTPAGEFVLSPNLEPVPVTANGEIPEFGIFNFQNKEGMIHAGGNLFTPVPKNGQPYLVENPKVASGMVEGSNVDFSNEMSRLIEAQRAFQMSLRMVQTSDEILQNVQNLR